MSVFAAALPLAEPRLSMAAAAIARLKMVGIKAPTDTTARPLLTKSRRVRIAIDVSYRSECRLTGDGRTPSAQVKFRHCQREVQRAAVAFVEPGARGAAEAGAVGRRQVV